jgi:alpha-L-fucosidase
MSYTSDPNSLRLHSVPAWFIEAKFGIFVHWSLSTIPAWAPTEKGDFHDVIRKEGFETYFRYNPYSEWYQNGLRMGEGAVWEHHRDTWGADYPYASFKESFNAALADWDPEAWAESFKAAGARYVVLVTKHHDGFCLWPSAVPNPRMPGFHTTRDVVGELTEAVRKRGMKMGLYYSGALDWTWSEEPIRIAADMLTNGNPSQEYADYAEAQYRELIARYRPSILWNDIAYPAHGRYLKLLADYYEAVPDGLVNDRWMQASDEFRLSLRKPPMRAVADWGAKQIMLKPRPSDPGVPFDYSTMEYHVSDKILDRHWECVRGIGHSFGYTANEPEANFLKATEGIGLLADVVSSNGNLLLNIGPKPGGSFQGIQKDCIDGMGAWLAANGEAIYGTRPWTRPSGLTSLGGKLRFTCKGDDLYAIFAEAPVAGSVTILDLALPAGARVTVLGAMPATPSGAVAVTQAGRNLTIELPASTSDMPLVLKIGGGNVKPLKGPQAKPGQPEGQLKRPKSDKSLVATKIIGAVVVIAIIIPLLSMTGFNPATSFSLPWALAYAAMVILSFGVLLSVDTASQVRKEMIRGDIAPETRSAPPASGTAPTRSPWRHVLPSAIPSSLVSTALVIGITLLLSAIGIRVSPFALSLILIVGLSVPVAFTLRRALPEVVAENESFLAQPAMATPVLGPWYFIAEHLVPRLVLMTAINLVLGLMIAAGYAAAGPTITASRAQQDWGTTFLILIVCCFSAAGDWTVGDLWSGRRPTTTRKPWLNGLLLFILLIVISYAAGFVYQLYLDASGLAALSPWTALVHKMVGVWVSTILGLVMGIAWTLPRTSRKVAARKEFAG